MTVVLTDYKQREVRGCIYQCTALAVVLAQLLNPEMKE